MSNLSLYTKDMVDSYLPRVVIKLYNKWFQSFQNKVLPYTFTFRECICKQLHPKYLFVNRFKTEYFICNRDRVTDVVTKSWEVYVILVHPSSFSCGYGSKVMSKGFRSKSVHDHMSGTTLGVRTHYVVYVLTNKLILNFLQSVGCDW